MMLNNSGGHRFVRVDDHSVLHYCEVHKVQGIEEIGKGWPT